MSHARGTTLTFFVINLSHLTFEVYRLVKLFSKLYLYFSWIAFIVGRVEEEDQ